jgi:hypothetical protein
MTSARRVLQQELDQLVLQRDHSVRAARTDGDREAALHHLLHAERLVEEIQAIRGALDQLPVDEDDVTAPIRLSDGDPRAN